MNDQKINRYVLYAPSIDKFLFTDHSLSTMKVLQAIISSKISTAIVAIDTATNFVSDFDNYICLNYTFKNLPSDFNFFEISILVNAEPYVFKGELVADWELEIDSDIKNLQNFLQLAHKVETYLINIYGPYEFLINEMCPEFRIAKGKDLNIIKRNCYEFLYKEKDYAAACEKIQTVIPIKL